MVALDPKYVNLSGLEPGCDYVFCAASKNRHGFSTLSPLSPLITTGTVDLNMVCFRVHNYCVDIFFACSLFIFSLVPPASISPNTPNTPGVSHPTSTALTIHFELPHDNGASITSIFLIVREGDRENGKCGKPLEYPLIDGRPALSDDPKKMKYNVLYRNVNNRNLCMIRINNLSGKTMNFWGVSSQKRGLFLFCSHFAFFWFVSTFGMLGDQQYGMQVAALNEIGMSPYSEMSDSSKTSPSVPPLPPSLAPTVTNVTPSSITVEWGTSGDDGGSPVCGFIVAGMSIVYIGWWWLLLRLNCMFVVVELHVSIH